MISGGFCFKNFTVPPSFAILLREQEEKDDKEISNLYKFNRDIFKRL
ncbi:beta-lactamase [Listeria monocytogenes]|nr:beta-lactamase [Listeria monocytogenes]MCN73643.1 beta-lactamase [Listeria monocytogenes]PCV57580.1 beta-lactamase [Listeria monocytogenes]PXC82208.1 beta-lactamase [Listeria monocytogenes]RFQ40138.1 beta-lactamase [Listeria monocytogenes]